MNDISAGGKAIVMKFWQYVHLKQRYALCFETYFPDSYIFCDIIKQSFRQCLVHVTVFVWDTNFNVFHL